MLYRYSMIAKKVTIDTVAAACGLSRTTVSAVLRGDAQHYRISNETSKRIQAAAESLGWKANYFARALNQKKSGTIGVLFPDVFERFMGEAVRGIEDALANADYRMILSTSRFNATEELRAIEAFKYRGVDGLLIVPYAPFTNESPRGGELVKAIGTLPTVVLDRSLEGFDPLGAGYGFVVQDDRNAARKATQAFATATGTGDSKGVRQVGFLGFDLAASSLQERRKGYREAAKEAGFNPIEIMLTERNPLSLDIETALDRIYSNVTIDRSATMQPGAWLVSTEGLAYKLASLFVKKGFNVGTDIQIARFGVNPPHLQTGLIELRQPHQELGCQATTLLLNLVNHSDDIAERFIQLPIEIDTNSRRLS